MEIVNSFILTDFELSVLEFLLPLSLSYPEIDQWYLNKVVPGFRKGTRNIKVFKENDTIVALGIAKKTDREKKVCTIRVTPGYQGRGYGSSLFSYFMDWLKTDKPVFTIKDSKICQFESLIDQFNFKETGKKFNSLDSDIYFN